MTKSERLAYALANARLVPSTNTRLFVSDDDEDRKGLTYEQIAEDYLAARAKNPCRASECGKHCSCAKPPRWYEVVLDGATIGTVEWNPGWDDLDIDSVPWDSGYAIGSETCFPLHLAHPWACARWAGYTSKDPEFLSMEAAYEEAHPFPEAADADEWIRTITWHLRRVDSGVPGALDVMNEPCNHPVPRPIAIIVDEGTVTFRWLFENADAGYIEAMHTAIRTSAEGVLKDIATFTTEKRKATLVVKTA